MKRRQLWLVVAACAALALIALWTWQRGVEAEPEATEASSPADTAAAVSLDASGERISQQLQDSLERSLEKSLSGKPSAIEDASDASSRLRQAERLLRELPDEPKNAGVRAALEREIAAERAAIEASGVAAQH